MDCVRGYFGNNVRCNRVKEVGMTTVQYVLNIARGLIGVHETPDGSNIAHPITDWAKQYGYSNGDAWCSWTVSYEFFHALPDGPALIYNHPDGYSGYFKEMGRKYGLMIPGPVPGAIDVMDFDGKPNFTDHVGIVESVNPDGSWVNIEGNHNNQVMRVTRRSGGGQHWFILPKYSSVQVPKAKEDDGMLYAGSPYVTGSPYATDGGKVFSFPNCWQGKYNYFLFTEGRWVNLVFRLIDEDGKVDEKTDPQSNDKPGDSDFRVHNLQEIVKQARFKGMGGSYRLIVTSDTFIKMSLREASKV